MAIKAMTAADLDQAILAMDLPLEAWPTVESVNVLAERLATHGLVGADLLGDARALGMLRAAMWWLRQNAPPKPGAAPMPTEAEVEAADLWLTRNVGPGPVTQPVVIQQNAAGQPRGFLPALTEAMRRRNQHQRCACPACRGPIH